MLNPLVAVLILIAGIVICFARRDKALIAFLAASILIPMDQVLLIGSLHFPMLRILILFGMLRLLTRRTHSPKNFLSGGINKIDVAVILFALFTAINGALLFQETAALVFQLGVLYTTLGVYFVMRLLIWEEEDVQRMIRVLAWLASGIAAVMIYERATGFNPYALLEGARASVYASVMQREDRFRAMGCFAHPILAGTFGAIVLPLFVGLWWKSKRHRVIAGVGLVSATIITLASNSSTPMLGYIAGVAALCLWPFRHRMRQIRWAVVGVLVSLHLAMKAPVWHLISRIDLAGGSSSYHRYQLVDSCIRHFSDWWLIGVKTTGGWGWDMWDTANQYVSIADTSGLAPLLLFLATIVFAFQCLGRARKCAPERNRELFLWGLGSALFANVVAFFGISYFDQTSVVWYALLAGISAATLASRNEKVVQPQCLAEPSSQNPAWDDLQPSLSSQMITAAHPDYQSEGSLLTKLES